MEKNLFIAKDGTVINDGSESACECYVIRNGTGFWPIGFLNGRRIFSEVSAEEWASIQTRIKERGGVLVGVDVG